MSAGFLLVWSLQPHSPSKQLAKLLKRNKTKTKPDLAEGPRLNNYCAVGSGCLLGSLAIHCAGLWGWEERQFLLPPPHSTVLPVYSEGRFHIPPFSSEMLFHSFTEVSENFGDRRLNKENRKSVYFGLKRAKPH